MEYFIMIKFPASFLLNCSLSFLKSYAKFNISLSVPVVHFSALCFSFPLEQRPYFLACCFNQVRVLLQAEPLEIFQPAPVFRNPFMRELAAFNILKYFLHALFHVRPQNRFPARPPAVFSGV